MVCKVCGSINDDFARFCNECGEKLVDEESKEIMNDQANNLKETEEERKAYKEAYLKAAKEYNDDFDDEVETQSTTSLENSLSKLSTHDEDEAEDIESKDAEQIIDHYFDDVLPEIEEEIYSIPKDNIVRVLVSLVGVIILIIWLVYWLS